MKNLFETTEGSSSLSANIPEFIDSVFKGAKNTEGSFNSSEDDAQNASSGDFAKNASSGDEAQNASSGYKAQNASSGDDAHNASSGYKAQNASSGDDAHNASSGDFAQNASSGNFAQNASSGDEAQNASLGDFAYNASSGESTQNVSSGDFAKNVSSGDSTLSETTGKNCINADIGAWSITKSKIGNWMTLAEYQKNEEGYTVPALVKTEFVDGEKIKEDVFYTLKFGKFCEVIEENGTKFAIESQKDGIYKGAELYSLSQKAVILDIKGNGR